MKSGRILLIAMMMTGCVLSNKAWAQYNSGSTPRSNASKAIKKNPMVNKKSSPAVKSPTPVDTKTTTPTTVKKPASSGSGSKTTTVKKPVTAKVTTANASAASTSTVSTMKKEVKEYDYRNALGVRAGQTSGITFKHFISSNEAIEGIVGLWPNAVGITGLYEKYVPSENVDGFSWYFGGGGHMSFSTKRLYYLYHEGRYYSYRSTYPGFGIGIDGIIGAEYKIPTAPLALSFDIKPFIEVNGSGVIFTAFDPGLGIKFTFK